MFLLKYIKQQSKIHCHARDRVNFIPAEITLWKTKDDSPVRFWRCNHDVLGKIKIWISELASNFRKIGYID